jgi:cold-inducible RNA-binding protein
MYNHNCSQFNQAYPITAKHSYHNFQEVNLTMSEAKIYVGNLSYGATDDEIQDYFQKYGSIRDVKVITDRDTGRSKGFAFVTFDSADSAQKALEADGKDLNGRNLKVSIAREQQGRTGGGGGRGRSEGRGDSHY